MSDDIAAALFKQKIMLVETLGIFALKTLLMLNAGATVVLLALLGNLQDGPTALAVDLARLQTAMIFFFIGLLCVMAAVTATYLLAQLELVSAQGYSTISTPVHLAVMILPPAASFLAFGYGFVMATFAFAPAI